MANEYKLEVACVVCNMILEDSITFPCDCFSCNEHLHDYFTKNNKINAQNAMKYFKSQKKAFASRIKQ